MAPEKYSAAFLARLAAVKDKRPKTVIDHLLKHGSITTEQLRTIYKYADPRRAIQDVRDQGIPIVRSKVKGADGRSIGAYRLGDPSAIRDGFLGGRRAFSKAFKAALVEANGRRCQICFQEHEERYLQIDHRVPYEVAGDVEFDERDKESYMLVCGSCNRAKSWSCEHCRNWKELKSEKTCESCYWASPESYSHIAMQDARRVDLVWLGDEIKIHDELRDQAKAAHEVMPEYVKRVLRQIIETRIRGRNEPL
jgi:hypothetical protein